MDEIPYLVGFNLNKAKNIIDESIHFIIEETFTPFEDKKLERVGKDPIIIRQLNKNGIVVFTVSYFK